MANTFSKIATAEITTSGVSSSLGITNIPSTYDDLVLYVRARHVASTPAFVFAFEQGNNVAKYTYLHNRVIQSSIFYEYSGNDTGDYYRGSAAGSTSANTFGTAVIYINRYSQTSYPINIGGLATAPTNASASSVMMQNYGGAVYNNYTVPSSVYIFAIGGNTFDATTSLQLYGIKNT